MDNKTFFLVKTDNTCFVLSYNSEKNHWQIQDVMGWLHTSPPLAEGDLVIKWLEKNGADFEAGYPCDSIEKSVSFKFENLLEYTEIMDELDIRR